MSQHGLAALLVAWCLAGASSGASVAQEPEGHVKVSFNEAEFRDRVLACWLGKNIGGMLGMPFEGRREMQDISFYTNLQRGEPAANDDLDLQLESGARKGHPRHGEDRLVPGAAYVAYMIIGWMYGENDYGKSLCTAVNCGSQKMEIAVALKDAPREWQVSGLPESPLSLAPGAESTFDLTFMAPATKPEVHRMTLELRGTAVSITLPLTLIVPE
ncbi:MAG: hypothetical protein AB1486_13865 [Planctomycetota bacterium]